MGYEIRKIDKTVSSDGIPLDMTEPAFIDFYNKCKNYSVCSVEPMYALFKAVEYVVRNKISGDLVECGVYKGGSAMMMAYSLMHFNDTNRKICLYDTFEGMSEPTDHDIDIEDHYAGDLLKTGNQEDNGVLCYSPIEEVRRNMESTGYNKENLVFVKGKVEDTIPNNVSEKISLLRLDTDWYESTYHELVHLYPLLVKDGVLIIDDYGHWKGARKAVDKYFKSRSVNMLLNRVDYTVRTGIKK